MTIGDVCEHNGRLIQSHNGAVELCADCGAWYFAGDDLDDWWMSSGPDAELLRRCLLRAESERDEARAEAARYRDWHYGVLGHLAPGVLPWER